MTTRSGVSRPLGPKGWKPGDDGNRPGAELIATHEFLEEVAHEFSGLSDSDFELARKRWCAFRAWRREQAARAYLGLRELPYDEAEWFGRY